MIRKLRKIICPTVEIFFKVNFVISIIVHLPFRGCKLRLLTHVGFFRQNDLILSEVFFVYGKEQESRKKCHKRAKKVSPSTGGLIVKTRFLKYREI